MQNITVSAISKDSTRVFLTPNGDTARGIWVNVGATLETLRFPDAPSTPKYRLAAWGEGKGVKGGFSNLRNRA